MEVIYIESKAMKLLIRSKKMVCQRPEEVTKTLSLNISNKTKL